jgi:subtilase family serine protease
VNRSLKLAGPLLAALAIAACNAGGSSNMPATAGGPTAAGAARQQPMGQARHACSGSRTNGRMQCDVLVQVEPAGMTPLYPGWKPADFKAAYNLPITKGAGSVIAIVDAYDNPNVASDLATYRTAYGLGKADFTKYNQRGEQKNYPNPDSGWGVEIDLDVQMVSASCPLCKIILIEADDNYTNNLYAAVAEAVKLGAKVVSNSYGGGGGYSSYNDFNTPGIVYLASSGDSGYGMQDPADYSNVVSVGGTVLAQSGSTYSETVWHFTGGGCSVITKPKWQKDPSCSKRTGNEVAAVAQSVSLYDTYPTGGWGTVAGTSVSSPLLAGVYGLAANFKKVSKGGSHFWTMTKKQRKKSLHYISVGSNGACGGSYLCTAGTNQFGTYSGPVGWGTPNGIKAF